MDTNLKSTEPKGTDVFKGAISWICSLLLLCGLTTGLLVLLFIALESGKLKLSSVEDCGQFMLGIMPVLFIAPAVGLMDSWPVLASVWPAVLAIIVLSTVVVFGVSGVVTQGILDFVSARADVEEPVMGQAEEVSDD